MYIALALARVLHVGTHVHFMYYEYIGIYEASAQLGVYDKWPQILHLMLISITKRIPQIPFRSHATEYKSQYISL